MSRNIGQYIFPVGVGLLGLMILAGIIINSVASGNAYRALQSRSAVTRVEMKIMDTSSESARIVVLQDDTICTKINQSLKYFNEIRKEEDRDRSVFVLIDIYKGKKVSVELLRTRPGGWVIDMYGTLYKNDSLIQILKDYLKLD